MLVEDDDPVRIFGARALRNKGYNVIEAKTGDAALGLLRNAVKKVDLLITDVVMPGMSGGQLAELLLERDPNLKVLFMSGYSEKVVLRHKISDLHTNFLQKPFTLRALAAKIREALGCASAAAGAGQ